jgi:hypothetical protein
LLYDCGCPFDRLINDINRFGDLFVFDGGLAEKRSVSLTVNLFSFFILSGAMDAGVGGHA